MKKQQDEGRGAETANGTRDCESGANVENWKGWWKERSSLFKVTEECTHVWCSLSYRRRDGEIGRKKLGENGKAWVNVR